MRSREDIIKNIENIEEAIDYLKNHYDEFDEYLDNTYKINIGGWTYPSSKLLKEEEPIEYQSQFEDFIQSDLEELEEKLEELKSELDLLDSNNNQNA